MEGLWKTWLKISFMLNYPKDEIPPSILAKNLLNQTAAVPSGVHTCPSDIWLLFLPASQGIFIDHTLITLPSSLFAHLLFQLPWLESNCFDWNFWRRLRKIDKVSHAGNIICSAYCFFSSVPLVKKIMFMADFDTWEKQFKWDREKKAELCRGGKKIVAEQEAENRSYKCNISVGLEVISDLWFGSVVQLIGHFSMWEVALSFQWGLSSKHLIHRFWLFWLVPFWFQDCKIAAVVRPIHLISNCVNKILRCWLMRTLHFYAKQKLI